MGAAVWHRYTYRALPPGRLAATAMIAIAPTAIMAVFLIKFAQAIEASHGNLFGLRFPATFSVIRLDGATVSVHPRLFSYRRCRESFYV